MADEKRKAPDEKIFRLREEGTPVEEQYRWLIDGAVDISWPGADFETGYGRILLAPRADGKPG